MILSRGGVFRSFSPPKNIPKKYQGGGGGNQDMNKEQGKYDDDSKTATGTTNSVIRYCVTEYQSSRDTNNTPK